MTETLPSLAIELRDIDSLVPYVGNARTHSPEQIAQIQESFRKFGVNTPVGVDEQGILVGHGRVMAMAGMWAAGEEVWGPGKRERLPRGKVPTLDLSGLDDAERRAYILADNRLAENAGWDFELLRSEIGELVASDFDVSVLGFDAVELADILNDPPTGLTDPDDAPPAPASPTTLPGDLWLCGAHRILCGDSTVATDVERALGAHKPLLMVTDPPYGVDYDPGWRNETGKDAEGVTRHKDSGKVVSCSPTRATGKVNNDTRADWREAWALFPGTVAYVWHGGLHDGTVAESLKGMRLVPRAQIIWVKTRAALGRGNYHWQHEPCYFAVAPDAQDDGWQGLVGERFEDEHEGATYAVRKGKPGNWQGGRKQTTVWFIEHLKSDTGHGTQKPVECMRRPILNNSRPGDVVYEPFLGSGTTVIAAEVTGRVVVALELDPAYVDVAVMRWQAFTGKAATLEGDGRSFEELQRERSLVTA